MKRLIRKHSHLSHTLTFTPQDLEDTKALLARERRDHVDTKNLNAETVAQLEEDIAEHGREEARLRSQIFRLEAASKSAIKAALRGRQYFAAEHLIQPLRVVRLSHCVSHCVSLTVAP